MREVLPVPDPVRPMACLPGSGAAAPGTGDGLHTAAPLHDHRHPKVLQWIRIRMDRIDFWSAGS